MDLRRTVFPSRDTSMSKGDAVADNNDEGEVLPFLNDRTLGVLELEGLEDADNDNDDSGPDGIFRTGTPCRTPPPKDSLLRKAMPEMKSLYARMRLRIPRRENLGSGSSSSSSSFMGGSANAPLVLGWIRSQLVATHRYTWHGTTILIVLAVVVLVPLILEQIYLLRWDWSEGYQPSMDRIKPHDIYLGGGGGGGAGGDVDWASSADLETFPRQPITNTEIAVVSFTNTNEKNIPGHFWHNPYVSPYASSLYKANKDDATRVHNLQREWDELRNWTVQHYGSFDPPGHDSVYHYQKFNFEPYKDLSVDLFPSDSWQSNQSYLTQWLGQAKKLVRRVKDAICAEYGLVGDRQQHCDRHFRIIQNTAFQVNQNGAAVDPKTGMSLGGAAYINTLGWKDGLVRRLLHAMMSRDELYVVTVGPAPSTYLGNNFFESHIFQFNNILEPVLSRLGVTLISRNMGMNASTTVSALGGSDVYGEADILWYSGESESDGAMDLLHKQMIISGERVPLLLTPRAYQLQSDAWVGNLQPGFAEDLCERTSVSTMDGSVQLPPVEACHYLHCTVEAEQLGVCQRYHSKCWVDRSDWNPGPNDTPQDDGYSGGDDGYKIYPHHHLESRKLAMLVLGGLQDALDLWLNNLATAPLPNKQWHLKALYLDMQQKFQSMQEQPGAIVSPCDKLLMSLHPKLCRVPMRAYTEWTPRVNPKYHGLVVMAQDGNNITDSRKEVSPLYNNVDLRPEEWRIPADAVNVHMVAIATNSALATVVEKPWRPLPVDSLDDDLFLLSGDDEFFWDTDERNSNDPRILYNRKIRRILAPSGSSVHLRSTTTRLSQSNGNLQPTWSIDNAPVGFCDGSAQSTCNRVRGNRCILANMNHYQGGVIGHGNSGWLFFHLDNVKEGIVLIRFHWEGGLDEMNQSLSSDLQFDLSVGGEISTWSRDEFISKAVQIGPDLIVHPICIPDESSSKGRPVGQTRVGVRIRSASNQSDSRMILSHLYYA